jgi:hypothetical protein
MSGQSDQQPPQAGATPVPDLIERYRMRRDAWIAQADELARLRDEVRGSAEREAMEIVTAARRDVRKVIMEARRELLVLSAQVQAALGEATTKTDPAILLTKAGITLDGRDSLLGIAASASAPEDAVNEILNEVQDEITALAEDARTLPLQAVPVRQITAPASTAPVFEPVIPSPPPAPAPARTAPAVAPPPVRVVGFATSPLEPEREEIPLLSELTSQVLLSSPFPSDAVPVLNDKRFRTFVSVFVGIGVVVAGVTVWWLTRGNSRGESSVAGTPATSEPSASAAGQPRPSASEDVASIAPGRSAGSANLSVVAEAVRDVWVRTTVDGRTDGGQTLAAGQSIDVSAERSISLRVGDAGAIVVSVNNKEKRPLGRDGQVVTREFVVEDAAEPVRTPARPPAPAPAPSAPAPSAPAPSAPARSLPPVASAPAATPRVAPPSSTSSPAGNIAAANPPVAPPTVKAPAPAAPTPGPAVNQLTTNTSQVGVPSGVVNQLSAPAAPLAAPSDLPAPTSPAVAVVAVARQWLDAYHRQDRAMMAALSTDNLLLADERRANERFPVGLSDVTRTLDRVSVQIAADTAVLTAVMMEQSTSADSPHVSPISQVWVLGGGQWKVRQARFVSEARLNQVFK